MARAQLAICGHSIARKAYWNAAEILSPRVFSFRPHLLVNLLLRILRFTFRVQPHYLLITVTSTWSSLLASHSPATGWDGVVSSMASSFLSRHLRSPLGENLALFRFDSSTFVHAHSAPPSKFLDSEFEQCPRRSSMICTPTPCTIYLFSFHGALTLRPRCRRITVIHDTHSTTAHSVYA